jgi:hypothetical protein
METIARSFVKAHRVETVDLQGPDLFPTAGLESDSIVMTPTDAFGFDRLDRVFTAAYRMEGGELTAFLSERPSDRHAVELAAAYRNFLIRFGGTDITAQSDPEIPGAVVVEILGYYELIFTSGTYLAGVHEAADLPPAISLARQLYYRFEEGRNGK